MSIKHRAMLYWLVISVVALIPSVYFLSRIGDPTFLDSAMGNWFATMVGALVGIVIALEISRIQSESVDRANQSARSIEERERKTKILALLREEMVYNLEGLAARQPENNSDGKRAVFVQRLKNELWRALSNGGEIQWIKDLQLLHSISRAYYHLSILIDLESRFFEATHFAGLRVQREKPPEALILTYMAETDPLVTSALKMAVNDIGRHLGHSEGQSDRDRN